MNNSPTVSVIVPVYKAEQYLHRCVDSLLAQTFRDFEVLLVDDGSPDRSGELCDEYAQKDSRVRVFHKENGGVSSARQCGIDNARGEYTIHADPDDWVEPTMLEELYRMAKETDADMVICDYYVEFTGKTTYRKQNPSSLDHTIVLRDLFQQLHGSCWNKLVRRACYNQHDVKFPVGINYCEDLIFNVRLIKHGIKITYLSQAFYHYDQIINVNSIVSSRSVEIDLKLFELWKNELPMELFREILPYLAYGIALRACLLSTCPAKTFRSKYLYYGRLAWQAHQRSLYVRFGLLMAVYTVYQPVKFIFRLIK